MRLVGAVERPIRSLPTTVWPLVERYPGRQAGLGLWYGSNEEAPCRIPLLGGVQHVATASGITQALATRRFSCSVSCSVSAESECLHSQKSRGVQLESHGWAFQKMAPKGERYMWAIITHFFHQPQDVILLTHAQDGVGTFALQRCHTPSRLTRDPPLGGGAVRLGVARAMAACLTASESSVSAASCL